MQFISRENNIHRFLTDSFTPALFFDTMSSFEAAHIVTIPEDFLNIIANFQHFWIINIAAILDIGREMFAIFIYTVGIVISISAFNKGYVSTTTPLKW